MTSNEIIHEATVDYRWLCVQLRNPLISATARGWMLGVFAGRMYAYAREIAGRDPALRQRLMALASGAGELFAPVLPHNQERRAESKGAA